MVFIYDADVLHYLPYDILLAVVGDYTKRQWKYICCGDVPRFMVRNFLLKASVICAAIFSTSLPLRCGEYILTILPSTS